MESYLKRNFVDLSNGEKYAYIEVGDKSKPVLVLIHGNMSSGAFFDLLFGRLKDDFYIVAPDLRGFGHTSYNSPYLSLEELADDLKLFFDVLGLKSFPILGWSLGGGVCLKLASKYPDYVSHLILHNSLGLKGYTLNKLGPDFKFTEERCVNMDDIKAHPITIMGDKRHAEKNTEQMVQALRAIWTGVKVPSDERLKIYGEEAVMQRCLGDAFYSLNNTFNMSDSSNGLIEGTNEFKNIKCKILGFACKKDLILPYTMAEEIKEKFGDQINLITYEDGGHSAMEDYPDEVCKAISEFVK